MSPPFSIEQFFAVFARYNDAIWPVQLVAYLLGAVAVGTLWVKPKHGTAAILAVLAFFWAWNGVAYHAMFFADINPAAYGFGALFVAQALLFAGAALSGNDLRFEVSSGIRSAIAWTLILYATALYAVIGYVSGHGLMQGPMFGVAPCPTGIFTIGLLLLARGSGLLWLSLIPIAWALVGTSAAIFLGVPEDLGLTVAMITLLITLFLPAKNSLAA